MGADVEVLCGDGSWRRATVASHWVRQRGWPTWAYFPYRAVLAESGVPTLVPSDTNNYIRPYRGPAGYGQKGRPKPEATEGPSDAPAAGSASAAVAATSAGATAAGAEATNEDGGEGRVKRQRVSAAADMIAEGNAEKVNAADADGEEGEDDEEDEDGDDDENDDEEDGENDDSDEDSAEGRYWAALHAPHEPAWRFGVGDKVLVFVEDWEAGTVELRDESDPPGEVS